MAKPKTAPAALLLPAEVAEALRLNARTVARMAKAGKFQGAAKVNDRWRIPRRAVDAYLASQAALAGGS